MVVFEQPEQLEEEPLRPRLVRERNSVELVRQARSWTLQRSRLKRLEEVWGLSETIEDSAVRNLERHHLGQPQGSEPLADIWSARHEAIQQQKHVDGPLDLAGVGRQAT